LADVKVPVRWWHGEADHVVPIAGVHTAVSRLQDAELTVRAESHLGGFAMIDEVLENVRRPRIPLSRNGIRRSPLPDVDRRRWESEA
jgi:predicted esterase